MIEPRTTVALELRNATATLGMGHSISTPISFSIRSGEVGAIAGENGSGKSRLLWVLGGLRHSYAGWIQVVGLDPGRVAAHVLVRSGVRLVTQFPAIPGFLSIEECVEVWGREVPQPDPDASSVLDIVGSALGKRPQDAVGTLSFGQQRFLQTILAVCARPRLLLLDEPLSGLSERMAAVVVERAVALVTAGTAILVVGHARDVTPWPATWKKELHSAGEEA